LTFFAGFWVKPKIGAKERERRSQSFMAHFFERPKKRAAKKIARHTALRLALRLSPRNEFKGPGGSSCGLARSADSDRNSFSSWLRLRAPRALTRDAHVARDDESRKAGRKRLCIESTGSRPDSSSHFLQSREGSRAIPRQDRHWTFILSYLRTFTQHLALGDVRRTTGTSSLRSRRPDGSGDPRVPRRIVRRVAKTTGGEMLPARRPRSDVVRCREISPREVEALEQFSGARADVRRRSPRP